MDIDLVTRRDLQSTSNTLLERLEGLEKMIKTLAKGSKGEGERQWATVKTLSTVYGASHTKIRDIASRGQVRTVKMGKFIAYNCEDFDKVFKAALLTIEKRLAS